MSYSNYHHNRQQSTQPFHHRGVLTKLTSSTSSSVGAFSSVGGAGSGSTVLGGKSGLSRGGVSSGLGVARNVPKLVNTSSLRKENGGQDITAVLVNRHGGKKSGWGSAITTPSTTKSKKETNSSDNSNKSNESNNTNNDSNDKTSPHDSDHDNNSSNRSSTSHSNDDHHHPMSPSFSGPTPEEAFSKKIDGSISISSNNNNNNSHHYGEGGSGQHDSKPSSYHHPHHQPTSWSGSGMNQDSSLPGDRDYHRDYHGGSSGGGGGGGGNYHHNNDRQLPPKSNDDFPPFGSSSSSNNEKGGSTSTGGSSSLNHYQSNNMRQSPPPGPPSQYHQGGYNDSRGNDGPPGQPGPGPPMRNYGRQSYNDHNYPPSSNNNLYDEQNDYHHQSHSSHRLYHNSRRYNNNNNEYYRGENNYYSNDRFGSSGNGGGGGNYPDQPNNSNSRHHYDSRRSSFDNDRYGNHHHNHHHQNSYYNHHHNMDYDRGYGGGNRRYNNYHSSSSPFDQERNHSRLFGSRSHHDQHLPPQRGDFGRNRDDFGSSSRGGNDNDHGFGSDHRSTQRQDVNYLHRSSTNRDSAMNYSVDEKIIEEDEGQNDDERSIIAPKQILKHEDPSFSDNNDDSTNNLHQQRNDDNNTASDQQIEKNHNPPQLTDEKSDNVSTSALGSTFANRGIETPSEKERRARLLRQQQENILRQVEATRAELARKRFEEQEKEELQKSQEEEQKKKVEVEQVRVVVDETAHENNEQALTNNNDAENVENVDEEKEKKDTENDKNSTENRETKDSTGKPVLDEEAIQKLKEEFYIRMAAERRARAEHRRRRKPRTRGVLFKRLPDGSIVNADLSEEEIARRAEKRMSRKENKDNGDSFRSRKFQNNSKAKTSQNTQESNPSKDKNDESEKKERKKFVPSPGPAQSAWIAGPPPSMKTAKIPAENPKETTSSETEPKSFSNDTTSKTVDQVLSSGLLDIGNNGSTTSWSADTSQPKVAMGPIMMSSWSAFSGNGGTVGFDSFGTSTKSAENTNVSGVDWNMDFALPHDLLSNAVDSEEEVPIPADKSKNKDGDTEQSAPPINKRFKKPMRPKKDFNKKFNKKPGNSYHNPNYKGNHPRPSGGRSFRRNNPRFDNKQKKVDNQEAAAIN